MAIGVENIFNQFLMVDIGLELDSLKGFAEVI